MLKTVLGEIEIIVNDQKVDYHSIQLDNEEQNFKVDGRYKIMVNITDFFERMGNQIVVVGNLSKSEDDKIQECVESGERLAMLSFYADNKKVSIGVEDELPGVLCTYEKNGIKVSISREAKISQITFGVAWIRMDDVETQDIYTWFAADPTMYKAYENIRKQNK